MSTQPYLMNSNNNLYYAYPNGYMTFAPSRMTIQGLPIQNPMLPNQLYSGFYQAPPRFYPGAPQPYNISAMVPTTSGTYPGPKPYPVPSTQRSLSQKIQKKEKQGQTQIVNLVSDDEEPVQPQKPCEDRNTTSNSKHQEYNGLPASPLLPHPEPKNKSHKTPPKAQPQVKETKAHPENEKPKEIVKHKSIHKKQKSGKEVTSSSSKRSHIHSLRILEKEKEKKPSFRVSKRERELLEIGYLREYKAVILTGPHFQVKLPSLQHQSPSLRKWLAEKREDLLARIYEEDSDDE